MVGFKRVSFKYVMIIFILFIGFILLVNLDLKNNPQLPEEDVFESEEIITTAAAFKSYDFYTVKEGENLSIIFEEFKVPLNTAYKIFRKDSNGSLRDVRPGNKMIFTYLNEEIVQIEIIKDTSSSLVINIDEDVSLEKVFKSPETVSSFKTGIIETSFYEAGLKAGIPDSIIMDFAYIFGWDIDFIFDVRKGDRFSVIFETEFSQGEKISSGDVVFAEFINKNNRYIAQRFYDEEQGKQYFNENGDNVKKAFLRAPLDFAYISSHFNPNRMHPILHRIKAHNGVDYAAKRNTPVKASGDGVISFVGKKSGYGRTLEIKHGGDIKTLYAHLEKFNPQSKVGSKVKQGDIVAYVGDSGQATGTHLHFEFWQGNKRTDPVKVKLPSAKPINQNQINSFNNLLSLNINKLNKYTLKEDE
ncbi:MAG: peptidoglycan DD-metalloendopeptidase family protein [Gammaproteobacteria bacterium]|jgi:murein DD-endopeptidase MepM/ murein hydrolase activator NlpD|tara:strand:+ start:2058 stop:3302 length:1245 start_codon:yes stop_codon:yes gene_type:complete